jgi:hypothetical protein
MFRAATFRPTFPYAFPALRRYSALNEGDIAPLAFNYVYLCHRPLPALCVARPRSSGRWRAELPGRYGTLLFPRLCIQHAVGKVLTVAIGNIGAAEVAVQLGIPRVKAGDLTGAGDEVIQRGDGIFAGNSTLGLLFGGQSGDALD